MQVAVCTQNQLLANCLSVSAELLPQAILSRSCLSKIRCSQHSLAPYTALFFFITLTTSRYIMYLFFIRNNKLEIISQKNISCRRVGTLFGFPPYAQDLELHLAHCRCSVNISSMNESLQCHRVKKQKSLYPESL